jgi:ABC-type sugar transport system ATPase subunit
MSLRLTSGQREDSMLVIEKLQVSYGKVQALWDVTLAVPDGEIVALVGALMGLVKQPY